MRLMAIFGLTVLALGSADVRAGDKDHDRPCHGDHCEVKTRKECFNMVCYYKAKDSHRDGKDREGFKNCKAAVTFDKDVTWDGGEVQDDSRQGNNPTLSVACDDNPAFYDNSAHRYTDLLGTRIQGQMGPRPTIYLPRGALHSGADGQSGPHTSTSLLDIDVGNLGGETQRMSGYCEIWTGAP